NSARFLVAFFGVSAFGRILVPVNFRLNADEVSYIIEHSGASVLLLDPELDEVLAGVTAKERILLDGDADAELFAPLSDGVEPRPWAAPDEDATCSINYTSGTTARPKGVQLTHRNCWLNASMFGWHAGVSDRDVYLHTLPMFHCNGWGMPYAVTAMGCTQVVQRKVDGEMILSRIGEEGVTLLCGAPAVMAAVLDAGVGRRERGEEVPGRDRARMVGAEATAAALGDGWFHTGDGGYLDGAHTVIADRKKDVIISGGENVSSIEVEDCLFQHPAVAEAAVIGVPDDKWGETVKALVVLRPGMTTTAEELVEHCRGRLAHFKCPTSVELRDALARTATGKLQKFKLRAPYWEGRERQVN